MYNRTATQRKYNNKVYSVVKAELPKALVKEFKDKCRKDGISQASIIRKAIEEYLKKVKD